MKLTVFGSTGRTGRHVGLDSNPAVAAVVAGDGREPDPVFRAVDGTDAVIAMLGAASRKGPHQVAEVAGVIVTEMGRAGVERLVITSAYPVTGRHGHFAQPADGGATPVARCPLRRSTSHGTTGRRQRPQSAH